MLKRLSAARRFSSNAIAKAKERAGKPFGLALARAGVLPPSFLFGVLAETKEQEAGLDFFEDMACLAGSTKGAFLVEHAGGEQDEHEALLRGYALVPKSLAQTAGEGRALAVENIRVALGPDLSTKAAWTIASRAVLTRRAAPVFELSCDRANCRRVLAAEPVEKSLFLSVSAESERGFLNEYERAHGFPFENVSCDLCELEEEDDLTGEAGGPVEATASNVSVGFKMP